MTGMLHIICTAYQRLLPLRILVTSLQLQTDPRWKLYVIHDGPAPDEMVIYMREYEEDKRITFIETPSVNGSFGHPNRDLQLRKLPFNHSDYLLITNDDNYYVPKFVEMMLRVCTSRVGLVFCDTLHSYLEYRVLQSQLRIDYIDMGSFITRLDIAKKIGFKNTNHSADGTFAVECGALCRKMALKIIHIDKPLFVHN
jgi:GT2 family glycosyltransferase